MAETICRALRDGGLEGELAPALTIKDTIAAPFGLEVFAHVLKQLSSYILAGKAQPRCLVLVAFSRCPTFYVELLKKTGIDVTSFTKGFHILDCYTDPLGWKHRLLANSPETSTTATIFKDVGDMDKLFSSIMELGREMTEVGKSQICVAIDSVNEILRHAPLSSVAGLVSNLRSREQVSSIFWSLTADLHDARVTNSFEYVSSMTAALKPLCQVADEQRGNWENILLLGQNFGKGKFHARFKRRNGRVRVLDEEFHVDQSGIIFSSVSAESKNATQSLIPKVQFNLQLSEKERMDRERVMLPFEHQGNGKPIHIYDGRRSVPESKNEATLVSAGKPQANEASGKGEIIYYRDSDDEMPDSDEDPDDDLDI